MLHTEAFTDVNAREVMPAILKCAPWEAVSLHQIPGPRHRVSLPILEAKQLFLD